VIPRDLPDGVVIGAITRDGDYVIPVGHGHRPGDHVVLFVAEGLVDEVAEKV